MNENINSQATATTFKIQKIYLKSIIFQTPNKFFTSNNKWDPKLNMHVHTQSNAVAGKDNVFDVDLIIKIMVLSDGIEVFNSETCQSGIFTIESTEEKDSLRTQHTLCPTILFPYAQESISSVVTKSGFPQLCIAPINFNVLYEKNKAKIK